MGLPHATAVSPSLVKPSPSSPAHVNKILQNRLKTIQELILQVAPTLLFFNLWLSPVCWYHVGKIFGGTLRPYAGRRAVEASAGVPRGVPKRDAGSGRLAEAAAGDAASPGEPRAPCEAAPAPPCHRFARQVQSGGFLNVCNSWYC